MTVGNNNRAVGLRQVLNHVGQLRAYLDVGMVWIRPREFVQ